MIANYTTGNGFYGASSYVINKGEEEKNTKAEVLHLNNLYGDTPKEISKEMREEAKYNRTQKPVLHVSFSFHQSEHLSNDKAVKAVESALSNVGITKDNHQYAIVKHKDTAHPHYHVIVNRVGLDQKLHNDYYLSNKLQASCDKVEKDMNLRRTEGRTVFWDDNKALNFRIDAKEIKKPKKIRATKNEKGDSIKRKLEQEYLFAKADAKNLNDFKERLEKRGISVDIKTNKKGVYGLSFRHKDHAFKASALGIKAKELNTAFEKKKTVAPSKESLVDNGIKELNQAQIGYLTERKANSEMLQEHKENLLKSGKSDVNQLAEKYNLNKEPFLSDLRLVSQKVNESKEEVQKATENKAKELKTLMETPYKKAGILNFGEKKREVERFNSELKEKQKYAQEEFKYFKESGSVIALKDSVDRSVYSIQRKSEIEMSKDAKIAQQGIKNDYFNEKGINLDKEISEREKAQRAQEREKNISPEKGGFSI